MDTLPIDLRHVSFSRAGSYLGITGRDERHCRNNPHLGIRPGLWLRHFHDEGRRDVFFLEPTVDGRPLECTAEATPAELKLQCAAGTVRFALSGTHALRVRCEGAGAGAGLGLRFSVHAGLSAGEFAIDGGATRVNAAGTLHDFTFFRVAGTVSSRRAAGDGQNLVHLELAPGPGEPVAECMVIQSKGQPARPAPAPDYASCVREAKEDFERFHARHAAVPEALQAPAYLASYINWSAILAPCGHFQRPAMLMSKNWMANVWSWDHCFTALALAERDPAAAWDQFMCIFDHQRPTGQLPDMINDTTLQYNHVKPPIHGWAYRGMMRLSDWFAAPGRLAGIYRRLGRWTDWWFEHRDPDNTGLPVYHHGNDSGWDNGTVFDVGQPARGPDCAAFLTLQMDVLAELAERLGEFDAASAWRERAGRTAEAMLDHLWIGDRFVTRHAETGAHNEKARSLINCMPLMIAARLPEAVRRATLAQLEGHLTDWGLASEHPDSELYRPDGYWRGPIWPSPTLLLIDGLREAGEDALAGTVAGRFLALCRKSGFAENYDAVTGAPLRDRSYTWSASVFLHLARAQAAPHRPARAGTCALSF